MPYVVLTFAFHSASVTLPSKRDIMPLLDALSPRPEAIGAVNNVVPVSGEDGSTMLSGESTQRVRNDAEYQTRLPRKCVYAEVRRKCDCVSLFIAD